MNGGDVRVIQRRKHLGLALESRQAFGIAGKLFGQDFDRNVAAELGVVGVVDFAHAAGADVAGDFVGAQTVPELAW